MAETGGPVAIDDAKTAKSDREDQPAVESKSKKSKLPTPRSFTLIPDDFYPYVASLSRQDWGHVALYVYRLANPRIVRDPSNVDSIDREPPSVPFTEQYLKETQGSGKFEVKLNDTDSRTTVCRMITDINDPEYPPKFDIRELDIGFKGNRLIVEKLKREGKLTQDGDVVVQKVDNADATMAQALKEVAMEAMRGGKNNQPGMESQAFGKMMEMFQNASNQAIQIALAQIKKEEKPAGGDPMIALLITLFTKQMDLAAKQTDAKPANDPLIALLMAQLQQSQKDSAAERQRNHELQLKMLEQKASATDPMEMVEKVLNIQEKLGGGEKTARRPGWPGLLEDHADQLIDLGKAAIGAISQAGYKRSQQQAQQPNPNQPQPAQTQQPVPQQQQPQQQPQPGAENVPQPQSTDPDIQFLIEIFEQQGKRLVAAFAADPDSGGDVAAAIAMPMFAGKAGYERIARMGPEKILQAMKLVADGAMYKDLLAAGTQEMLNDFIADFINPPVDDDESDAPIVPEVVTIEPKPARKKKEKVS